MLTISIAALMTSITSGFSGVDSGRLQSTAIFLAEQRLEHVRAFVASADSAKGFANLNTTNFPAEDYGAVSGYPQFRRTVTFTDNPGGTANSVLVEVRVFYRPPSENGVARESSVNLPTLLSTLAPTRS